MEKIDIPPIGITAQFPELGTGPVPTDLYHDPVLYAKELEAVFKTSWFMLGRVEQIPEPGNFIVVPMPTFNYSVILTRNKQGEVKALHNVCRHRGNAVEHRSSGKCSTFMCRFHGWSFDLNGKLLKIRDEEGFFDLDKSNLNLLTLPVGVWNGFIFVSPEETPTQSLEDFLGELGNDLAHYPFENASELYQFEAEVNCNWKLLIDSFSEVYHIPVLHPNSIGPTMMLPGNPNGRMINTWLKGPHRFNSHFSSFNAPKHPVQKLAYENIPGPSLVSAVSAALNENAGVNPTKAPNWSVDLAVFFPGTGLVLSAGMYAIHQVWPLGPNKCFYIERQYHQKARTAAERFGQENSQVEFRDLILEDLNTLERIQRSLDAGLLKEFHFHDHEAALRHQHHAIMAKIEEYENQGASARRQRPDLSVV